MGSKDVARRFKEAGGVVQMPARPKYPTVLISGRKYVTSNYWPAMGSEDDEASPGGARLIKVDSNPYRYLWVYDTERGIVAMWRHSDGDEKVHDRASSATQDIYTLERRKQLNRVTHDEFVQVERFMQKRSDESLKFLKELAEEATSDFEHQARKILKDYYEKTVRPVIVRRLGEVEKGVIPFGFKVNENLLAYKSAIEQAKMHVISEAFKQFDQDKAYEVVSDAVGFDAYEPPGGGDIQAVQWAYHDLVEKIYEDFK